MKQSALILFILGISFVCMHSQESAIKKPGRGMILLIDSDNLTTAESLLNKGSYYVQILQKDKTKASALTEQLKKSTRTGQISIRQESFAVADYGANIFNLILIETNADFTTNLLEDMNHLLVPGGTFALKTPNKILDADATKQGFQKVSFDGYPQAFQRSMKTLPLAPPIELKWKAGARSQIASGYKGICTATNKLFYIERMEADIGTLEKSEAELFARDAFNGQILWRKTLDGHYHRGVDLVATSTGRLFVKDGANKIYGIDGNTGETLFNIDTMANNETSISLLNDDLFRAQAKVFSTADGKFKWNLPYYRSQPLPGVVIGDRIFFCNTETIFALDVKTGTELWRVATETIGENLHTKCLRNVGENLIVQTENIKTSETYIAKIDQEKGVKKWDYTHTVKYTGKRPPGRLHLFVKLTTIDQSILLYYRQNQPGSFKDQINITKLNINTGKLELENHINPDAGDYHGCFPEIDTGDYIAYYDLWFEKRTLKTLPANIPHPACFFGMHHDYGLIYNFPSRKSEYITAVGIQKLKVQKKTTENKLVQVSDEVIKTESVENGWPIFRGDSSGGNYVNDTLGKDLKTLWEKQISEYKPDFGEQSSLRTGISQAVGAYGMLYVSDIDGQRVVALDENTGNIQWATPLGARIDFPPTIYKGYCLVPVRNGWVYALSAKTGNIIYQLYMGSSGRLISVQGKLEAEFPATSDVYIQNDIAYVSSQNGGIAFEPTTGKVVEAKGINDIASGYGKGGRNLWINYDMVIKGNTIPRTNEDNKYGFYVDTFAKRLDARVLSFDEKLTVAFEFIPKGEGWANTGTLQLSAYENDLKKPKWQSEPIEFLASDIVISNDLIYSVGHYQRISRKPELWILDKHTGKTIKTIELNSLPGFLGLSAYNKSLYIATRDGKLIRLKNE